jgi:hypothetical protein
MPITTDLSSATLHQVAEVRPLGTLSFGASHFATSPKSLELRLRNFARPPKSSDLVTPDANHPTHQAKE